MLSRLAMPMPEPMLSRLELDCVRLGGELPAEPGPPAPGGGGALRCGTGLAASDAAAPAAAEGGGGSVWPAEATAAAAAAAAAGPPPERLLSDWLRPTPSTVAPVMMPASADEAGDA